jgi:DUF1680 family protein
VHSSKNSDQPDNEIRYSTTPVHFTDVQVNDQFWSPRMEINRKVAIPRNFQSCEETGRIDNFSKAGGLMEGEHKGIFYNDSDVFKVIEGAAYSLGNHPDKELEHYLDELIDKISAAQEDDGYLYTVRTITERSGDPEQIKAKVPGLTRWSFLRVSHELYNVGHMYEAAVAYFKATGKRALLDVSIKNADLIDRVFGVDKRRDVPGHQEIEIGLVKLYQVTGDNRYLKLARFFLDERGHANGRELYELYGDVGYMQDHLPILEQTEAVGHAVRAVYMYCGIADVAVQTADAGYVKIIDRIWKNVVGRKLYLTGGIGARHNGEAFGDDYELPNDTAFAETCAAVANIFWNQRMFQLHADAKFVDVLERTLYNGFISGVSLSGDRFFYVNPLSFDGKLNFNSEDFNSEDSHVRQPWFSTACCPPNVARLLSSLSGYIYATREDSVYVNLFISSQTKVSVAGQDISIRQVSNYPWDGEIKVSINLDEPLEFTVCIRIPGWAQSQPVPSDLYRYLDQPTESASLVVNDEVQTFTIDKGFAVLRRTWQSGDQIVLTLPMVVRRAISHEAVDANRRRVALERGPLVYCAEQVDQACDVSEISLPDTACLNSEFQASMLNGLTLITARWGSHPSQSLVAIPYYAWSNREVGEMAVWLLRE